jgi:DNA relaxase NicK
VEVARTEIASSPFALSFDWLTWTFPSASVEEVIHELGGEWQRCKGGFRGYPMSLINGSGRLAYGAPERRFEVSVDLPGSIVRTWAPEKFHRKLSWIFAKGGHLTRIDCALDDRRNLVSIETVRKAMEDGQYVTRARRANSMKTHNASTWSLEGETIYIGSQESATRLRIYNKSSQLKLQGCRDWSQYGTRWELQLRKARAQALGQELVLAPQHEWRRLVVGVVRSFVDFRDVTRTSPKWRRSRAEVLPWWEQLTEGFERAILVVEEFREWGLQNARRSLKQIAPGLSVLADLPGGWDEIEAGIEEGRARRKPKHLKALRESRALHDEDEAISDLETSEAEKSQLINE